MEQADSSQIVILGSRTYRVTDFNRRTVIQDHYMQKYLRLSGGDKLLPGENEGSTTFIMRLQCAIVDSGFAPQLLAGLLLPEGMSVKQWTHALADSTAVTLAALDTAEDRETIASQCVAIAFEFFREGLDKLVRAKGYGAMAERSLSGKVNH